MIGVGSAPVASLSRAIAAPLLISALTITSGLMDVVLPVEDISPLKLAFVVTVAAVPVILIGQVPVAFVPSVNATSL